MGALTVQELLDEGGLLASDDSQEERALIWFNNWLTKTYRGWEWPFNKVRTSGLTLAGGATSLLVGAGNGGVTDVIQRIYEPVYVYLSDGTRRGTAFINELLSNDIIFDEAGRSASSGRGLPTSFKCRANNTTYGAWSLIPFPIPDMTHLLQFDYLRVPARLTISDTPVYPEDRTLLQAAKCAVMEYSEGPGSSAFDNELGLLASMVGDDRVNFGSAPGDGEYVALDRSVFR